MSEARLEQTPEGNLRVLGALDFLSVPALWQQGRTLLEAGDACEVDLAGVERTDSAGVALLVDWTRHARAHAGTLRLRHIPAQMSAIVQVSGVQAVLDIADDAA
ncbi:MAG: STAS domain-containing protein [Halorhodospira sp.]